MALALKTELTEGKTHQSFLPHTLPARPGPAPYGGSKRRAGWPPGVSGPTTAWQRWDGGSGNLVLETGMTLPCERTRAVIRARDFLLRLCTPYGRGFKRVSREVREEARRILRHYPGWYDLGRADAWDADAARQEGERETDADCGMIAPDIPEVYPRDPE